MPKVISSVSQKGGEGKTTCAVNLATALAIDGRRVLLIDLDPQSSVKYSFGIGDTVACGTKEFLIAPQVPSDRIIRKAPDVENLEVVLSNIFTLQDEREINDYAVADDYLENAIRQRAGRFDVVVVDSAASIGNLTLNSLAAADYVVSPLQCEKLSTKSLVKFLTSFRELQSAITRKKVKLAGILMTMFEYRNKVHQATAKQLYSTLTDAVFQTIIPRHGLFTEASAEGKPIFIYRPDSAACVAFVRLKREMMKRFDLA